MTHHDMTIEPAAAPLRGEITVPGDKSVSHRSLMFAALCLGDTRIRGFLRGADCLSTMECLRRMGIQIEDRGDEIIVRGRGLRGLSSPSLPLDAGNSGTTIRLMSGILAGQTFSTRITGDASIQKRPMKRIMDPLRAMGAGIESLHGNDCAPLLISGLSGSGQSLRGISYASPVASAQVKSCILLAGLYADAPTCVTEPALSRDHSERMLRALGADVSAFSEGGRCGVRIMPQPTLRAVDITVPGDISSAAYFIAAALLVPGSSVCIRGVGINPTRDGIVQVARRMGGSIKVLNRREEGGEPVCDLLVESSHLTGIRIEGDLIPTLIDELPVIAVMAACARGETVIADAAELKVKESDRIATVSAALTAMGIDVTPTDDGMIIRGRGDRAGGSPESPVFTGSVIDSHGDHRIAMSFTVAALAASSETTIKGAECVNISYPDFYQQLYSLQGK